MRELGYVLGGCFVFVLFFANVIYPQIEYKGYPSAHTCTGECYEQYVKEHGTVVEQLVAAKEAAAGDPFSSIRGLWAGCAACHGQEGQGVGAFPKLAGQSADYISEALYQYKNNETRGAMSATMWAQAGMLSEQDIQTLSEYIQQELK